MKTVTSFKIFENKKLYAEAPDYSIQEMKKIFQQLIDNGDIVLGNDNKSFDDLLPKFINKKYKYDRFGFEAVMIDFTNNKEKAFISEGDKDRMGDYISKMKNDFGVDTSKLDEILPRYKRYYELLEELDDIQMTVYNTEEDELEGHELEEFKQTQSKLDDMDNEADETKHYVSGLIAEMVRLAPEVVKQL